jgi:DNA end-binding protein Ku
VAPRALWRGFLKLSFVACPVALYPAIAAKERLSFRRVNRRTGHRLRQQLVDAVTGEPVQSGESGRGYQIGQNQFLIVDDEDVKAAEQEGRDRAFLPPAVDVSRSHARSSPSGPVSNGPATGQEGKHGRREPEPVEPVTERPSLAPPVRIENNRTIEIDRFIPRVQWIRCTFKCRIISRREMKWGKRPLR